MLILLIIAIPLVLLSFALQVFLSLQKNKWLGLILPTLNLLIAAFLSFGTMIYMGEIAPIIMTFILLSIPAIINFVIYSICRVKVKEKNNKELEKMNIQDLD
jgi:hypothetical protein